jgi:hypothetical protein
MTGQNADKTGLVVSVADNVVTFLSNISMQDACPLLCISAAATGPRMLFRLSNLTIHTAWNYKRYKTYIR